MMVASAAAVVLQGFFAVWLSFWVTAFLIQKYFIKLIFIAGLLALGGMAAIVRKIFQKVQTDNRVEGMRTGGLTIIVYPFVQLYRMIFQLALSSDSPAREFKADHMVAKLVSPQAITQSLIKIAAYANYRANTENALFQRDNKRDGVLGIADSVARGLHPYALSHDFFDDMRAAHIPHPFDSHPAVQQRMQHVGHVVPPEGYGAVVTQTPAKTWANDIISVASIEARLWSAYA